ncbi:siderophore-interacting protein [Nocardioides sp.]|uniref:siderophore-interacting protein n=1 Tax=Nocardioides sp. TaxID=35761 RepID=UPI002ED24E47
MTSTTAELPLLLGTVEVRTVQRLSPSFVRVELGAPLLGDLGVVHPWYDQRIKLVFPGEPGAVPALLDKHSTGADESWFSTWLDRPEEERGHMRTYSIRDVVGEGEDARLVVDIVVHEGATGPGNSWALNAAPGDRLAIMAPRRGHAYGGIEWHPEPGRRLLIAGDETAVPAICVILEQLPASARGTAFVEVPYAADVQDVDHPTGVEVVWLPREGAEHGTRLHPAVTAHLGAPAAVTDVSDEEVDPDLWETPTFSSSCDEPVDERAAIDVERHSDLYAWIAGESKVVTGMRRHLVRDLGIDRRQVAFMGYWRRGVSMRS